MNENSLNNMADLICMEIKNLPFYQSFSNKLLKLVSASEISLLNFENELPNVLAESGLQTEIENNVYYWMKTNSDGHFVDCWMLKEPIEYLRHAQMQWEIRIYKSLNTMCLELSVPLSVSRSTSDRKAIMDNWDFLSSRNIDCSQYRPVYAPKDFLDILFSLQNPNHVNSEPSNSLRNIPLKVKTLSEIKQKYSSLSREKYSINRKNMFASSSTEFEKERICLGEKILEKNCAQAAQHFLRSAVPNSLRPALWKLVLDSKNTPWRQTFYTGLKNQVIAYDMLIDKLLIKDIQLTARNDDQYFIFEDLLYPTMLCFSRDTSLLSICRRNSANPITTYLKGKINNVNNIVIYPPNAVVPFHGFSMYAAPLCYIFDDPGELYFSFRSFYSRYWYKLQEVSSAQQGILALCVLFEKLLDTQEPTLRSHFDNIAIQPLRIAFKWLIRGFSGYLPPEQLLRLWDLILGNDSLEIIPVLAAAIFTFRKPNLVKVSTHKEIETVLADLSSLEILPLLQLITIQDT